MKDLSSVLVKKSRKRPRRRLINNNESPCSKVRPFLCLLLSAELALSRGGESSYSRRRMVNNRRGSSFLWDSLDDDLMILSESEGEERILSALAEVTQDSWDVTTDDEAVELESDRDESPEKENSYRYQQQQRYKPINQQRRYTDARTVAPQQERTRPRQQQQPKETAASTQTISGSSSLQYVKLPENYQFHPPLQSTFQQADTHTPKPAPSSTLPHPAASMTTPWVRKFLATCHRDVLLPVPKDYCLDNFNLAQLAPVIERIARNHMREVLPTAGTTKPYPIYRQALRLIVQDDPLPENIPEYLEQAARALYLLIHQRYVLSPRGMDMVRRRFLLKSDAIFGHCPRLPCRGMPLLPYGDSENWQSDNPSSNPTENMSSFTPLQALANTRAKRYCACCGEVFYHWDSKVDGCAWGPSFCHLFLLVCGPQVFGSAWRTQQRPLQTNEPRIFGFRLHPSALL